MQIDIRTILRIARETLAVVAPITSTPIDDRCLELLDLLASSDSLLDWLESLVPRNEPPTMALQSVPAAIVTDAEQLGADWSEWLTYLPAIIALLRRVLSNQR